MESFRNNRNTDIFIILSPLQDRVVVYDIGKEVIDSIISEVESISDVQRALRTVFKPLKRFFLSYFKNYEFTQTQQYMGEFEGDFYLKKNNTQYRIEEGLVFVDHRHCVTVLCSSYQILS
jgi:hypothetical protein